MQKTINGKLIKITKAGYLYINGIKQSGKIVTPLQTDTDDIDALSVCQMYNRKYWRMV
jgi:hypothetical protein